MATVTGMQGAAFLLDRTGTVVEANERCRTVFKCRLEEIRGTKLQAFRDRNIFDERTFRVVQAAITDVRNDVADSVTEEITVSPHGSNDRHRYDLRVTPGDDQQNDGRIRCSFRTTGTSRHYDETITALHAATREMMAAESKRGVLRRAATAANDVLRFPGTGVRIYDSRTASLRHVFFGGRVNDIDSRPPYPVDGSPHGDAFRRGETVINDIENDDPYDRDVFTQTMYIPIGTDGLLSVGTIGNTFGETDIQFAEILAENAAAALRVVETTASLKQEREQLTLLKQIFTRVLRHNIRNDVNVIKGNAELLANRIDSDTQPIETVLEYTDDILTLSEKARDIEAVIDSSNMRQRLNAHTVVQAAVRRVSLEYPDSTVSSAVGDQCTVWAHERLEIALENLLENACEHHPSASSVVVRAETTDDTVYLEIEDDGPGIPPDEIAVIEAEDETDLWHGSGLGLWLVKLVVDLSNGSLEFDTDGSGTCVRLGFTRVPEIEDGDRFDRTRNTGSNG